MFLVFEFVCGTPPSCLKVAFIRSSPIKAKLTGEFVLRSITSKHFASIHIHIRPCQPLGGWWVGGDQHFSVSPSPGLVGFGTKGVGTGLNNSQNDILYNNII